MSRAPNLNVNPASKTNRMPSIRHTFTFLILLALPCAIVCANHPDEPLVAILEGTIRGESIRVGDQAINVFRGIPFAAPPVDELRWRPPQPHAKWEGVRDCLQFAPACPQPAELAYGPAFRNQSEDCLYLNVWAPTVATGTKRPVMVWIHGGGNVIGGASSPVYDGRQFAALGVVLVSIQYRLGPFGFLAHPDLTAEAKNLDGRAASGNYGLLDQIAALQWIQSNIERFGGDSNRVTIFGESAGAANVTYLMSSPLAKGLFHRAIAQSGYFGGPSAALFDGDGTTDGRAHKQGTRFAEALGASGVDSLARLRKLSAKEILEVPLSIGGFTFGQADKKFVFRPVIDGYVLPSDPIDVWTTGKMQLVPFIAGSLRDDGSIFSNRLPIKRMGGYKFALGVMFGADADRAAKLFPAANDDDVSAAVEDLCTVLSFRAPARRLVRWIDQAGGKAWLYHFSREPDLRSLARRGVFHGLEIPYVFNTLSNQGIGVDRKLAEAMIRYWIAFASDGDPNGGDSNHKPKVFWPAYNSQSDRHLEFGDHITAGEGLDRESCDLIDELNQKRSRRAAEDDE